MKRLIHLVTFLIGLSYVSLAQENKAVYQSDTLGSEKSIKMIGLPVAFVTPETGFGFGGGAQFFLPKRTNIYNDRPSTAFMSIIYTAKKQLSIEFKPQIYIDRGNYLFDMAYLMKIFPNSFWGIGNKTLDESQEQYNMISHELSMQFLKRLPPALNFGFEFVFQNHNVTEVQEGGIFESGVVLGGDKAVISGLGIVFNLDNRDNVSSPLSGHYLQWKGRFSSENFGASSGFNKFITDLRGYTPLGKKSVLATQIYIENSFGDTPFQGKAWFGGGERGRGYFKGRFIDDHLYVIQAEYRARIHPRWTLAGFGLIGEVSDLPGNFFGDIKPSFGGGARFKIFKDQETLIRLDIGIGEAGSSGFYVGVNEAF